MQYRKYGSTGLSVSEVGVGCSRIGGVFATGTTGGDEVKVLRAALDAGINLFDTSDVYAHGRSEVLLGRALRGRRHDAVIATKGGFVVSARMSALSRFKPALRPVAHALRLRRPAGGSGPAGIAAQDFTPDYLIGAVERSLRRLGTDYIDIYQLHSPAAPVVQAGEFIGALEQLRTEGKIRAFGIAAEQPDDACGFERFPGIGSVQVPFSIIDQRAGVAVLPKANVAGVGVISRSCFAAGLLVGDLPGDTLRERTPAWQQIVQVREVAAALGRPVKELAVKFNSGTIPVAATVLGLRTWSQLTEITRCAEAPALTEDEREALLGTAQAPPQPGHSGRAR